MQRAVVANVMERLVVDVSRTSGVDEPPESIGVVLAVASPTTCRVVTGWDSGAGGRIRGMGAVLPSETVCTAALAKECQANVNQETTGVGTL
jgi:hypothetical protein